MKELLQLILFDSKLPDWGPWPIRGCCKKTFPRDFVFNWTFSYSCEEALFFGCKIK